MPVVEQREYERKQCASFRKTGDQLGGLSNMAPGYPLDVSGIRFRTSEALYQALRFPHLPEVQQLIIDEVSPMTAKMKSKPFRVQSRPDWEGPVRVRAMRWCLRVKLAQNWEKFSRLLLSTGELPIVEESRKDDFWGAKPTERGTLIGRNVLGRMLMELREEVRTGDDEALKHVAPPSIDDCLLLGRPVGPTSSIARTRGVTTREQLQLLEPH